MKLALLLLALISLPFSAPTDDCSSFSPQVIAGCEALSSGSTKCIYSGNQCISSYTECTNYAPASGFDDATCTRIIPTDPLKKCIVKTEGSTKSCVPELKKCSDHTSDDCISLQAGDGQRCLLLEGGKCEAHYNDCTQLTSQGEAKCVANIPNDKSKMCAWSSNACAPTDRTCEKYIVYSGPSGETSEACLQLHATSPKICIFENGKTCRQEYEKCENGNGNENLCKTIRPLNTEKTGYDHQNICQYTSATSTCGKVLKECLKYEKGFDDGTVCLNLKSSNTNKMCSYDSSRDECSEIYITCSSYNTDQTNSDQREDPVCKAITPKDTETKTVDPLSECFLDTDKSCKSRKKSCDKFTDEALCHAQVLDDTSKRCLFVGNTCKEISKTCDDYTTKVEAASRNKEDCKIITYTGTDTYIYRCAYDSTDNLNKCEPKKIQCEDYKGSDAAYCSSLSINIDSAESTKFECRFVEGKCSKQYKACEIYDEDDRKTCESIKLTASNSRCILEHDKTCKTEIKACSEYSGKSEAECSTYKASSTDKTCSIVNGKCIETLTLNYCSDYKGTNKEECESIQPHYNDGTNDNLVDGSSKCVFATEGCIKESKKCGEAKSELECTYIIPSDNNKQCAFVNNACVEQYKTCQLYNENEEAAKFSQTGCESIIFNEASYPFTQYKCKYTAPTTGAAKGTCERVARSCSEFKAELIKNQCTTITTSLSDISKKCVFNSNVNTCSLIGKTCLELNSVTLTDPTADLEQICKNAVTSSSEKNCSVKDDDSGCEEIDKEPEVTELKPAGDNTSDDGKTSDEDNASDESTESENNTPAGNNNSCGRNYLNKIIIFIALYLLI